MNQEVTTTAVATFPVQTGIIPKPTRKELLNATAVAIAAESRENNKIDQEAYNRNELKARKVFLRRIKNHLSKAGFYKSGTAIELRFPGYSASERDPVMLEIVKEYMDTIALVPVRRIQTAKDVFEELQKKLSVGNGDARIQQILADPKTKKALIQMGNAMLD